MDYPLAIARNRTALLAVVAAIVALLGGRHAAAGPIARRLRNAALAMLRPAEAAARRLIVIAARGLEAGPRRPFPDGGFARGPDSGHHGGDAEGGPGVSRPPAFRLFDPPRRFAPPVAAAPPAGVPRIRSFGGAFWQAPAAAPPPPPVPAIPPPPDPDAPVDAARLRLRLAALERALADLPRQARRLARWRGRRDAPPGRRPRLALRPGRPPGWTARPRREVDVLLRECHALARDLWAQDAVAPDTS